jgi:predicted RNA-binding protein YlxR (DUF448 family)
MRRCIVLTKIVSCVELIYKKSIYKEANENIFLDSKSKSDDRHSYIQAKEKLNETFMQKIIYVYPDLPNTAL